MSDQWGQNYLRLMLEVNKHCDGFVDAYFGQDKIKADVDAGDAIPVSDLRAQLNELRDSFDDSDPQRNAFVMAMITAAETALRLNTDDAPSYVDEVKYLFDIEATLSDEAPFQEALQTLDDLLPGTGTVPERQKVYADHYNMSTEQLHQAIKLCLAETRKRTADFIDMVEGEGFVYATVTDKPWGGYNWYKGNGQSLIEVNTDLPVSALGILDLCAHEGYPGHHTENMLKEALLYKEKGRAEHAVVLLLSPAAVIAEGIAMTAREIIFPDDSTDTWLDEVLFPAIGLEPHPVDVRQAISKARKDLRYVGRNAAFLHNSGELNTEETIDYYRTHTGSDLERAQQFMRFITSHYGRAYIFTYTVGYDLIDNTEGDKAALFKRLLTEPMLPSDLG